MLVIPSILNHIGIAMTTGKEIVTIGEIAALLKCSEQHVMNLRDQRLIPCIRLGRLVRYDREEVLKAIEKLTVKEHDAEPTRRRKRRKLGV